MECQREGRKDYQIGRMILSLVEDHWTLSGVQSCVLSFEIEELNQSCLLLMQRCLGMIRREWISN